MKLLVVEDSPLLRKMFGLAFPHQLNDLKPAENGREAMELLAATAATRDRLHAALSMLPGEVSHA